MSTTCRTIPISRPTLGEEEAAAAREAILSGLGDAGPAGGGVRGGVRRLRRRAARLRRLQLHDRAAPGAARAGRRAGRRGHHGQPFVHRHRQRGPLLRRRCRCSWTSTRGPTTWTRRLVEAAITPRTKAILPVHQIGSALRPGGDPGRRRTARAAGRRGRGLRDRQRDPRGRPAGSGSAGRTATSPASRSTRAR